MSVAIQPVNKPQDQQQRGTTTSTLIIPARQAHRRTLVDYFVKAGASSFSDISIGAIAWNRIYDNLAQAKFVSDISYKYQDEGFIGVLKDLIPDMDFPTATQDESITIARNAAPTRIDAYFEDKQDGDVITRDIAGGSLSKKQLMIINLNNNVASTVTGFFNFDKLDMPVGLTPFSEGVDIIAAGRRMSAAQKFTLYAVAADVPLSVGSRVTRVHIQDETIELFASENQEGLLADITNGQGIQFNLQPVQIFKLPTPYTFMPNRVYNFRGELIDDGANHLAANSQKLFLIGVREYIAI